MSRICQCFLCNFRPAWILTRRQNEGDTNVRAKSDPGSGSPPLKRQRLVFDGVVVPTLAPVRKRKAEEDERDFKKLALLKNVSALLVSKLIMAHRDVTVAQG